MLTLPALLRATARTHGERTAIRQDDFAWSWREYVERIARGAAALRALGLEPGQRVGILARNSVAQARLLLAGAWSGVVPVPMNFRLASVEIRQMLDDAGCARVFVDDAFAGMFDDPSLAAWQSGVLPLAAAPSARGDGGDDRGPGSPAASFDALADASAPVAAHDVGEDDEALVLFTGGTTGRAKGVSLSHRNVVTNAMQLARPMAPDERDVYLHVSPMFHSTDLKATVVTMFGGGHTYLGEFSVDGVLRAVERHRVTILSLVPTMIVRLLREAGDRLARSDLSSLRLVSYGTSPIDEGVLREAMRALPGVGFHQCYGLTETSPLLAVLDEAAHRRGLADRPELLRAAGRPLAGVELRLVADDGGDAEPDASGEIVVRGPQVSRGYINVPGAPAWRGGWFHTGDIGRLDRDGYLHVLGRLQDMVITGGENVYTREVERVLEQHPQVREVAVVGVADAQFGESLLAAVVADAPPPTPEQLVEFCRGQLGGFKIPRRYVFVPELPRTSLGKVRKRDIVAKHEAEAAAEPAAEGASGRADERVAPR